MPSAPSLSALKGGAAREFLLKAARGSTLIFAGLAFLTVVGALVTALVAQTGALRTVRDRPAPAVSAPHAEPIATEDVAARLAPPTNIRFVQDPGVISVQPFEGQALGYFDAATPNKLSPFPDDFDIVGGAHAGLFALDRYPGANRTGLRASAALVQALNAAPLNLNQPSQKQYQLRVIARDAVGQVSAPADILVTLNFGPPGAAAPAGPDALTPLQILAREIARTADPSQTEVYFETLRQALQTPRRCGAEETEAFVGEYQRAFEAVRSQITRDNVGLFFRGVCDAWAAASARGEARQARKRAAAADVIASNQAARAKLAAEKRAAETTRNLAIGAAASALIAFLLIAMAIAFLAMERHSKAMREAVAAIARQSQSSPLEDQE